MKTVKKKAVKKVVKKKVTDVWAKAKSYIGIKQVDGVSMTLGAYNRFRGWAIPDNEDPKTQGFMVKYPDGYISWSPKPQFEDANMTDAGHDFSAALFLLKQGHKIARKGWNGKKMWLILVPGSENIKVVKNTPYSKAGCTNGLNINAHIDMMTATGDMQPGWLASQTDMLAEDWCIVK